VTPEEYAAIVEEVEADHDGNGAIFSKDAVFIKPAVKYSEERVCKCGNKYTLGTPYADCQPVIRDLCDECISRLSDGVWEV
jgi:hypothetical protein